MHRLFGFVAAFLILLPGISSGQAREALPDIASLFKEVQQHQRELDRIRENYTYRESIKIEQLDKGGKVKKTNSEEREVFYVNAYPVRKLVKKDGVLLSENDRQKEEKRVQTEIERATKSSNSESGEENKHVRLSRLLEIAHTSNLRRADWQGRKTFVFDFAGDPSAKTKGLDEDIFKHVSGKCWVDESDRQIIHAEVALEGNVHFGLGLMSLQKGSTFVFDQEKVNGEIWLPSGAEIFGQAKAFGLLGYRGRISIRNTEYKKFHVDAEQGQVLTSK